MMKRYVVALLSIVMLVLGLVSVRGAAAVDFRLSDTEASKGRLFETTLSSTGSCELSSFVAELTYDEVLVQYRSAKAVSSDAIISVNSTSEGRIVLVYLCEQGVDCSEGADLVTLTFKLIDKADATLKLDVRDTITPQGKDLSIADTVNGSVICLASSERIPVSNANDTDVLSSEYEEEYPDKSDSSPNFVIIGGEDMSNSTKASLIALFIAIIGVVGYVCYKIGAKKQKNKIPLEKSEGKK